MPYGPGSYGTAYALPLSNVTAGGSNAAITTYQPGQGVRWSGRGKHQNTKEGLPRHSAGEAPLSAPQPAGRSDVQRSRNANSSSHRSVMAAGE